MVYDQCMHDMHVNAGDQIPFGVQTARRGLFGVSLTS